MYLETLMYLSTLLYFVIRGDDFTNYGENFFLLLQNVVILILMWYYGGSSFVHVSAVVAAFAAFCVGAFSLPAGGAAASTAVGSPGMGLLDDRAVPTVALLIALPVPLMISSRFPQVAANFRNGHTGIQSRTTFVLNTLGGAARVFTTLAKPEFDSGALALTLAGFALNFTLACQCFLFAKKTREVLEKEKQKKTK